LVNSSLFRALEEKAHSLQKAAEMAQDNEQRKDQILHGLQNDTLQPLAIAIMTIDSLLDREGSTISPNDKAELTSTLENLHKISKIVESLKPAG
jgi:K+-sensing histidine kinase KdpD